MLNIPRCSNVNVLRPVLSGDGNRDIVNFTAMTTRTVMRHAASDALQRRRRAWLRASTDATSVGTDEMVVKLIVYFEGETRLHKALQNSVKRNELQDNCSPYSNMVT